MIFIILFFKLFERTERDRFYYIHRIFANALFTKRIEIRVDERP